MNSSASYLVKLGKVKLSDMKTLPFLAAYYKGNAIPRTSMDMCKEYDGDCFKFVNKFLKVQSVQSTCTGFDLCHETFFKTHVCTPDEISQKHYDTGRLYFCPPAEELYVYKNYEYAPYSIFKMEIRPNYDIILDRKEV